MSWTRTTDDHTTEGFPNLAAASDRDEEGGQALTHEGIVLEELRALNSHSISVQRRARHSEPMQVVAVRQPGAGGNLMRTKRSANRRATPHTLYEPSKAGCS